MKTIWKIIIFIGVIAVIFLIRTYTFTPTLTPETAQVCSLLNRHNKIDWTETQHTTDSTQGQQILNQLADVISDNEIYELSKSLIPIQRAYAAYLAQTNTLLNFESLVHQHLNDAAEVELHISRNKTRNKIGDIYLQVLFSKLNYNQQEKVDSLVIFNKNNKLQFRKEALCRQAGNINFYERIREICKIEPAKENYIHLAKYKQDQDVPIFQRELKKIYSKNINYILEAVTIFPHPQFLGSLINIFDYIDNNNLPEHVNTDLLFAALLKYKEPVIFSRLQTILINNHQCYPESLQTSVFNAIMDSNSDYYIPLTYIKVKTVRQ